MSAAAPGEAEPTPPASPWRLRLGALLLLASFCAPALIPWVTSSDLPAGWKTALSGALALGIPEIGMVLAVAVMGKAGYQAFKRTLLRRLAPARRVGRLRHRIGVVMFVLPLLLAWITPYVGDRLPGMREQPLAYAIAGDLLLVASLFVLGGDFWERLRELFLWRPACQPNPADAGSYGVAAGDR